MPLISLKIKDDFLRRIDTAKFRGTYSPYATL